MAEQGAMERWLREEYWEGVDASTLGLTHLLNKAREIDELLTDLTARLGAAEKELLDTKDRLTVAKAAARYEETRANRLEEERDAAVRTAHEDHQRNHALADALRVIANPPVAEDDLIAYHGQLVRWVAFTRERAESALAGQPEEIDPAMTNQPRRMWGNGNTSNVNHMSPHDWFDECDMTPPCTPITGEAERAAEGSRDRPWRIGGSGEAEGAIEAAVRRIMDTPLDTDHFRNTRPSILDVFTHDISIRHQTAILTAIRRELEAAARAEGPAQQRVKQVQQLALKSIERILDKYQEVTDEIRADLAAEAAALSETAEAGGTEGPDDVCPVRGGCLLPRGHVGTHEYTFEEVPDAN